MTDREKAIDFLECRRGYYASLSTDPSPYVEATKVCGYTLAESANACLTAIEELKKEPIGYCKDCKYFEYDSVTKVNGIPIIVAHEICKKWGEGCKTSETGYCFLFESKMESEG